MAETKSDDNHLINYISRAVKEGIKKLAEDEFEKSKKEMIKNLDKEKDRFIAGLVINIMKTVEFQDLRDRIVFTIHKEENK